MSQDVIRVVVSRSKADEIILAVSSHGIYKWQQAQSQAPTRRRSLSFSGVQRENSLALGLDPSLQHIHEPGGFRRQFVINRAVERGEEEPRVLRSFIDFLYLYGHFVSRSGVVIGCLSLTAATLAGW